MESYVAKLNNLLRPKAKKLKAGGTEAVILKEKKQLTISWVWRIRLANHPDGSKQFV